MPIRNSRMAASVLKEAREDRAVPAEGLLPAIGSLADRILQVAPHLPQNRVRVIDDNRSCETGSACKGRPPRSACFRTVRRSLEQLQTHAGVEQTFERVGDRASAPRPARTTTWDRHSERRRHPATPRRTSFSSAETIQANRESHRDRPFESSLAMLLISCLPAAPGHRRHARAEA